MNASTLQRSQRSQRGVALVITLILLAVITFMAITFLVVSRTERGSVSTQTDLTIARLAADTARNRAIAETLAPILATNNPFNYGLLVSTNYINTNGFDPTALPEDLANVNYDYTTTGTPLTLAEQLQNLQNLFFNARPPVFIVTNAFATVSNEFRFYRDMNRNGAFEPTGVMPYTNNPPWSPPWPPIGPETALVGDPQWIGILQHPELYHSPTNLFTARYAYIVVPIGLGLDENMMHNYAKGLSLIPGNQTLPWPDGFLRNQGILPAELNLAGFLVDLNTNAWPYPEPSPVPPFNQFTLSSVYSYSTNLTFGSLGNAAEDASAFVRYRYATNLHSLANVGSLFGPQGANAFNFNPIDFYSEGPLMTGTSWPPPSIPPIPNPNPGRVSRPYYWEGAENPSRFFTPGDLFDRSKFPAGGGKIGGYSFVDRLMMAGADTNSTYNRYTFYRLLSELGTDSAPEPSDKMNLNYCNVDKNGSVVPNAETGFTNWTPAQFFTNAVIRLMVDAGYTVGPGFTVGGYYSSSNLLVTNFIGGVWVTNLQIPIWPTNYYTPSLHRLLQLAANLYDATTNRGTDPKDLSPPNKYPNAYPYLPTVFRPLFYENPTPSGSPRQVFVNGYSELPAMDQVPSGKLGNAFIGGTPPHDLSDVDDIRTLGTVKQLDLVYNVPVVIGAKKGLPSFDELTSDTQVQAARKLIYHRGATDSTNLPVDEIDPAYYLTVTNVVGLQAWNSYGANYTRPVQLYAWPDSEVLITNLGTSPQAQLNPPGYPSRLPLTYTYYPCPTPWPGLKNTSSGSSFVTPLGPLGSPTTNYVFLPTNSVYLFSKQQFDATGLGQPERTYGSRKNLYIIPHFQLTVKARLRFALVDQGTQRLLDYVNLAANQTVDITTNLVDGGCGQYYSPVYSRGGMWCTNTSTTDPKHPESFGIHLQIDVSQGNVLDADWTSSLPDPVYGRDKDNGIARFNAQFGSGQGFTGGSYPLMSPFAAPYSPFRNMHLLTLWVANDPLVHYTVGDLQDITDLPRPLWLDDSTPKLPPTSFGQPNRRYEPWGGAPLSGSGSPTRYDWRVKDPVAQQFGNSDSWDFTTYKFASPGWLGRVHRGTPWQTVYLKSPGMDYPSWIKWSGDTLVVTNFGQLAQNMPQWVSTTNIFGGVTNIYQVAADSAFTEPTNDWRLLDLFSTALDANATRGRMSINQTNLAAWSAVLSGVIALTNDPLGGVDTNLNRVMSPYVIQPAGVYDPSPLVSNTWPAIVKLVTAINTVRTNTTNPNLPVFPNGVFHRLGDLLSVPELTAASPFLWPHPVPAPFDPTVYIPFSDAAMERIPQQILGLLKCDPTPRVVIYAFGQTLKPAVHSRVTSGPFFGLVTNYQITAEFATRTVVRFDGVPPYQFGVGQSLTNLHPVIESFNVLPQD